MRSIETVCNNQAGSLAVGPAGTVMKDESISNRY
jgi:hypothetical protein